MSRKKCVGVFTLLLVVGSVGSGCGARACPSIACPDTFTLHVDRADGSPAGSFEGMVDGESFECRSNDGGSDNPPSEAECVPGGLQFNSVVADETISYQVTAESAGETQTASGQVTIAFDDHDRDGDACTPPCKTGEETVELKN